MIVDDVKAAALRAALDAMPEGISTADPRFPNLCQRLVNAATDLIDYRIPAIEELGPALESLQTVAPAAGETSHEDAMEQSGQTLAARVGMHRARVRYVGKVHDPVVRAPGHIHEFVDDVCACGEDDL